MVLLLFGASPHSSKATMPDEWPIRQCRHNPALKIHQGEEEMQNLKGVPLGQMLGQYQDSPARVDLKETEILFPGHKIRVFHHSIGSQQCQHQGVPCQEWEAPCQDQEVQCQHQEAPCQDQVNQVLKTQCGILVSEDRLRAKALVPGKILARTVVAMIGDDHKTTGMTTDKILEKGGLEET